MHRIAQIPGCEVTALSDINPKMLDANKAWLKEHGGLYILRMTGGM